MAKKSGTTRPKRAVAVIDGCRVPFQRSGTGYYDLMAWELGRYAVKGLLERTGVDGASVDHVIMGCVATDIATTNVAREVALGAGIPTYVGMPAPRATSLATFVVAMSVATHPMITWSTLAPSTPVRSRSPLTA